MNFITLSFAFFFLFVLAMSALFRKGTLTYKIFLLSFNIFFYAFTGFAFIPLLLFVGAMNWLSAKLTFDRSADIFADVSVDISAGFFNDVFVQKQTKRKIIIGINIFIHVCLLVFYKYYEFVLINLELAFNYFAIPIPLFDLISTANLIFPIGLSFYTFQGLSYAIDQYRKPTQKPESFLNVLLFVSFFPTILAGPILRGHEFFPQLNGDNDKDNKENTPITDKEEIKKDIAIGFSFILSGLFKKVVLASYLSEHIVRDVFLAPDFYSSTTVLIAVYAYAMQIYCDFSGYSDIAVGIGRLMGYKLPQNFNAPYLACNLQDFWRRWHITLSLWLRDYLYIPLGGNKKGNKSLNLIITMMLGGLWHGSHLRFLIWGLMHGIGLSLVHLWQSFIALFHKQKDNSLDSQNQSKKDEIVKISLVKNGADHLPDDLPDNLPNNLPDSLPDHLSGSLPDNLPDDQMELLVLQPLLKKSVLEPTIFTRIFRNINKLIAWFITFHFVSLLWIFFRADDTVAAFDIIKRIIAFNLPGEGFPALVLVAIFMTMFLQFFGPYIFRFFVSFLKKLWSPIQILLIAILCAFILKLGPDGVLPFIYFQF